MTDTPILALENARISYFGRAGEVNVVPGLTFSIAPGEAMGLVGESGCGKSTVALAIVRYLGRAGRIMGGRIVFEGRDVAAMTVSELRAMRGPSRRHGVPGPDGQPQPGDDGGPPAHGSADAPRRPG